MYFTWYIYFFWIVLYCIVKGVALTRPLSSTFFLDTLWLSFAAIVGLLTSNFGFDGSNYEVGGGEGPRYEDPNESAFESLRAGDYIRKTWDKKKFLWLVGRLFPVLQDLQHISWQNKVTVEVVPLNDLPTCAVYAVKWVIFFYSIIQNNYSVY